MIAKTESEIEALRTGGKILAEILQQITQHAVAGATTASLDLLADKLIRERGCVPAFFGYKPRDASYPFPATLCVTINDEVVHGIPSEKRILQTGDLVMLDLGLSYKNFFVDAAITVCVGNCDTKTQRLIDATREALSAGIASAVPGNTVGDIGAAIEAVSKKYGYSVAEDLGGHGVGKSPHEKPYIANVGPKGSGEKILEGMVLALEPIFTEGDGRIGLDDDEWTYRTIDGSRSAEFEHTILVTKNGAEILTKT